LQKYKTMGLKYLLEDSKGNTIVDNRQVLIIWQNYITKLYDRPNGPLNFEDEPKEEVDAGE
jgi:hypothetical protein